jgi:hypothetical protein
MTDHLPVFHRLAPSGYRDLTIRDIRMPELVERIVAVWSGCAGDTHTVWVLPDSAVMWSG